MPFDGGHIPDFSGGALAKIEDRRFPAPDTFNHGRNSIGGSRSRYDIDYRRIVED